MYSVRLRSGARHGETPRIGGNPKNQPISELDIFSKRQALSRAVVVNSNMSRGKYLAREGPGSRLGARSAIAGPNRALLRRGFFCRERFARIFLSCPTPVLSGRISLQPITKLASFLLKYFAVVLNYLPNEWILRGEAPGYWLRPVLSTRGEQLIPADDRKEETTLPYSFSP